MKCVIDEHNSYICLSCDKALHNTSNKNPIVPYHVKNKCLISAANFMKSLQDKPEYVCTCCHCLLYKNTVKVFHAEKYDLTNSIVKKCLSYRYQMRIFNNGDTTQTKQYVQHDWPQMMRYTTGRHNSYEYMDEYICIRCSTSLQWSKPKMPDQACANNLNLDDIPQDLTELSTMERRLISYRLPFMTLIAIKRYGGHNKVNGPPVNIPAKLDQIVEMLP